VVSHEPNPGTLQSLSLLHNTLEGIQYPDVRSQVPASQSLSEVHVDGRHKAVVVSHEYPVSQSESDEHDVTPDGAHIIKVKTC
jgi:hypothetical protein